MQPSTLKKYGFCENLKIYYFINNIFKVVVYPGKLIKIKFKTGDKNLFNTFFYNFTFGIKHHLFL